MNSLTVLSLVLCVFRLAADQSFCSGPIELNLRYNVSNRFAINYLPYAGESANESLVEAVCCDPAYRSSAEPRFFFKRPDIALFDHLSETSTTTFYDPVCGIPLLTAPQNRSFAEWRAETDEHGWPSFRFNEIVNNNIVVDPDSGAVSSTCGTHLGSNLPDDKGPRLCLDLSCLSGTPKL
jgi:hypothetical protein